VLAQVNALRSEHLVGLRLDDGHLLAKFDFATVETDKQVSVQGVDNLVLLREVGLADQLVLLLVSLVPFFGIDIRFKQVFLLELFCALSHLTLLFVAFVFVERLFLGLTSDSVALLSQDKSLPCVSDFGNLGFKVSNFLVVDGDAHACGDTVLGTNRRLHALLSVLNDLADGSPQALDRVSEVASFFEQVRVVDAELGVHNDVVDEGVACEHSVKHVEGLDKLVLDLDDVLVQGVDQVAEELLLVSHFNVHVDALEHWQEVFGIEMATDVVQNIAACLEVVVAKGSE